MMYVYVLICFTKPPTNHFHFTPRTATSSPSSSSHPPFLSSSSHQPFLSSSDPYTIGTSSACIRTLPKSRNRAPAALPMVGRYRGVTFVRSRSRSKKIVEGRRRS